MNEEDLLPEKIFIFFIRFLSDKLLPEFKLVRLIFILVMTMKGLTKDEIFDIVSNYHFIITFKRLI